MDSGDKMSGAISGVMLEDNSTQKRSHDFLILWVVDMPMVSVT